MTEVADLLVTGVKIIGTLPKVGIWTPRENPALISLGALLEGAASAQQKTDQGSSANEHDEKVWALTMEEVEER